MAYVLNVQYRERDWKSWVKEKRLGISWKVGAKFGQRLGKVGKRLGKSWEQAGKRLGQVGETMWGNVGTSCGNIEKELGNGCDLSHIKAAAAEAALRFLFSFGGGG